MSPTSESNFELPLFAGVDVGGTNVKAGIVDDRGSIVASTQFPTLQERGASYAMQQTRLVFDQLLDSSPYDWADVVAAGLGTPGPMDIPNGVILTPTNLPGWHNHPVRDELSEVLGCPVSYANDAAAAAFGEYWVGAGANYRSIVLLTLGTGVGGGIIIDDISIDGANSHGAEVGHVLIDHSADARICGCGHPGHLEAYASATAVVARGMALLGSNSPSVLREQVGEASPLSALMIAQAAADGDQLACQIVDETAKYLGLGIANLAHTIDPALFLLGGAMNFGGSQTDLGQKFLNGIIAEVKKRTFAVIADNLKIEFAEMGSQAGFVGAAGLGRRDYYKQTVIVD